MGQLWQALSIKQPWAALLVHGIKTIEIRSWPTAKLGKILIHASKSLEPDPAAWDRITTPALIKTAGLVGGIIGVAELFDCITYTSATAYAADAARHCAGVDRFRPPVMYGFRFRQPRLVTFLPWVGNTNFFGVEAEITVRKKPPRPKKAPAKIFIVRLPEDGPR
jgi:hypothetical protein